MSKNKMRGITDRDLANGFHNVDHRLNMLTYRAIKQRGYNRTVGAGIAVLYLFAFLHAGYFHFAGYYAWVGLWVDYLTGWVF